MATFTSDAISGNSAFQNFPQGNLGVRVANYSIGAALAANDIIQMCDVFAGETVYGVMLTAPDLDTGGSPAIVLDCSDRSYYRDYLNDRKTYVRAMMKELDWDVIEGRI